MDSISDDKSILYAIFKCNILPLSKYICSNYMYIVHDRKILILEIHVRDFKNIESSIVISFIYLCFRGAN